MTQPNSISECINNYHFKNRIQSFGFFLLQQVRLFSKTKEQRSLRSTLLTVAGSVDVLRPDVPAAVVGEADVLLLVAVRVGRAQLDRSHAVVLKQLLPNEKEGN